MAIEIVDKIPWKMGGSFHSYVSLPEVHLLLLYYRYNGDILLYYRYTVDILMILLFPRSTYGHRFGIMTMPPPHHWASLRCLWSQYCKVTWQRMETMEFLPWKVDGQIFFPKKMVEKYRCGSKKCSKLLVFFSKIAKNICEWKNGWIPVSKLMGWDMGRSINKHEV